MKSVLLLAMLLGVVFGLNAQDEIINGTIFKQSNGNVGIGVSDPAIKLSVAGKGYFRDGNKVDVAFGTPHGANGIIISGKEYGNFSRFYLTNYPKVNLDERYLSLSFYQMPGLVINHEGNIGIGTTSPSVNLEIKDNVEPALMFRNNNGTFRFRKLGADLILREGSPLTGDRMTFKSGGNIGIGISSPTSKLHVNGDVLIENTSGQAIFNLKDNTGDDFRILRNKHNTYLIAKGGNLIFDAKPTVNYGQFTMKSNGDVVINSLSGNTGIGTSNPGSWKLAVNGKIRAKEVKVETGWSDFVFESTYELPTLKEVEHHIKEKGHLKDIPSAKEVSENGIFLGDMNAKLLQKIEELTLYTLQQEKQLVSQSAEMKALSLKVEQLKRQNEQLGATNTLLFELQKRIEALEDK